jgi:hypothetical protein
MLFMGMLLSSSLIAQIVPKVDDGDPGNWPAALNDALNTKKTFARDINEFNFGDSHKDDGYTQGTSNNQRVEEWRWVFGNTNDKGDIENAGSILIGTKLYFFGDRSAFNGTAELGFWFLLDEVGPTGTGATPGSPFSGTHKNGDLLILNTFTSGGRAATPKIFMWKIDATHPAPGSLVGPLAADAASITNELTTYPAPGGTSGVVINIPAAGAAAGTTQTWRFTSKKVGNTNKDDGTYYPPLFFEGYVDLASIPDASTCFQSFIMKTTTSANNTAANVDLVAGHFTGVPNPPSVTGDEKCYGFAATATATCTGSEAQWYDATTNALVHTGASLTLPAGTAAGTYNYNVTCKSEDGCESGARAVSIIINPEPTVNGLVTTKTGVVFVSDDLYQMNLVLAHDADLTSAGASGTAPYKYTWSRVGTQGGNTTFGPTTQTTDGNANFSITNLLAILDASYDFSVALVDDKGCTATDIVTIVPNPGEARCNVDGPDPVCAGSTGNVYINYDVADPATRVAQPAQTGFSYAWSISGNGTITSSTTTGAVISATVTAGSGAGTYTVTLTITNDAPGIIPPKTCSKTATVILVTASSDKTDVSCNGGSDGTITAVGSGGTAPYSYTISPAGNPANTTGATSGVFTGLAAGTYTVTATDVNNCSGTTSETILQPDPLSCSLNTPTILTCGSSGTVTGTISGGTADYTCSAAFDAAGVTGGWIVTNCVVSGTGITVSYTSGLNATSAVLTVNIRDSKGCTSSCTITVQCTGGQSCSPGFWRNQTQYWDQQTDVAVNNMPGTLTNPVTPGGTFVASTNFWAYFDIPVNQCGLSTNASLTMAQAMVNSNIRNVDCKNLVFHGIANLLSAALLPNTYPFPAGSGGTFSGLYTQIRNAFVSCDCSGLGNTLGAISALHTGTYCQDAANALNSIVNREITNAVDDGGIDVSAYPNPYNNVINFKFASPTSGKAVLEVYDIVGRRLAIVYQGNVNADVPVKVQYNVPTINRVSLIYKLTVNNKSVRGNIVPEK